MLSFRGTELGSWVPRNSHAAWAPRKVWAVSCACSWLGGSLYFQGWEFYLLSPAFALDLAIANQFAFPTLGLQTAVTSSPTPNLPPAGIDDGFGWASLPLGSSSSKLLLISPMAFMKAGVLQSVSTGS